MYTWKQLLNKAHSLQARLPITKLRKVWSYFDVVRQLSNICIPSTHPLVGGQIEPYIIILCSVSEALCVYIYAHRGWQWVGGVN